MGGLKMTDEKDIRAIVENAYHAYVGKEADEKTRSRILAGVQSMQKIEKTDRDLYNALLAAGIKITANKILAVKSDEIDRLANYFAQQSKYLK